MPLYEYECGVCGYREDQVRSIDNRHQGPGCSECNSDFAPYSGMKLVISPVRGFVKFPAAGGQEYVSPSSGRHITTERARRDDLARTNCRPYEGFESETKEAKKRAKVEEAVSDAKLHDNVSKAYYQLPPDKRKVLAG